MRVTLTICGHFDAAHRMPSHSMKTRNRIHGHTYHVRVTLDNVAQVFDMETERSRLSSILLEFDHRQIAESKDDVVDDHDALVLGEPVSMEALARRIATRYQQGAPKGLVRRVRVSSQPDAYAEVEL